MKKIRIIATPEMEFGGRMPNMGNNINSPNVPVSNQVIDPRWRQYNGVNGVYAYAPDAFQTKRTIPKTKEMNHREGEIYDVDEEYANHLRTLGYEFNIVG